MAILVSVLAVSGISIFSIHSEADENAEQQMSLICENRQKTLNEYLNSIEQSVDVVSRYVRVKLDREELVEDGVPNLAESGEELKDKDWDSPRQKRLDSYLDGHLEDIDSLFRSVSIHTNGVVTYYYRINPKLTRNSKGFWYSRLHSTVFKKSDVTDIEAYEEDDVSHVGWYYLPIQRGCASWLEPYYNANLGIDIISYVTPIYKAGALIGVVGMDIDFSTLVEQIDDIHLFRTGYACLTDPNGVILYHPELERGTLLADISEEMEVAERQIRESRAREGIIRYSHKGIKKKAAWARLSNGLRLMVVAPVAEISERWFYLSYVIVIATLLIVGIFILISWHIVKKISEPLVRLTEASRLLTAGEYKVDLTYRGQDEIGILTGAFQKLVEHLQVYISDLSGKAYKDALTSVKNKAAYDIYSRKLEDLLHLESAESTVEFAVVMCDCNELKRINDLFGHDKGDLYLQKTCSLICKVFSHSPVFRIGGDEFVSILEKEDFENRGALLNKIDRMAEDINAAAEYPWEMISLAKGMAVYDSRIDQNVESVLQRADAKMYDNKRKMKSAGSILSK